MKYIKLAILELFLIEPTAPDAPNDVRVMARGFKPLAKSGFSYTQKVAAEELRAGRLPFYQEAMSVAASAVIAKLAESGQDAEPEPSGSIRSGVTLGTPGLTMLPPREGEK
jgi:hypothetical protein